MQSNSAAGQKRRGRKKGWSVEDNTENYKVYSSNSSNSTIYTHIYMYIVHHVCLAQPDSKFLRVYV